jgi:hypothetical protein
MQQIADWLEKLGLSEYTARFAENGIDISVVRYLTDQDLKDIGVLLGHRRKMLAAISELTGATPVTSEAAAVEAQPKTRDSAERRQVTVMFSDLVGSDGALRPYGPGGPAGGHRGLSQMCRRDRALLRWVRRAIFGRRRSRACPQLSQMTIEAR